MNDAEIRDETGPEPGDDDDGLVGAAMNPRTCIVSRKAFEQEALIRIVAAPDGTLVADMKRRLPGRGAHVELRRATIEQAVKRKLFGRALKMEVQGAEGLADQVDELLKRQILTFFGMTRKAGQLVVGATKVDAAARSGAALAVLHALDGAEDGIRKIAGARRAAVAMGLADEVPAFRLFTVDEMGLAFGGGNVIHAAVLAGEAGAALLKRLEALSNYRGERPTAMAGESQET
ncbi:MULTISPECIES: RNA-binding protein [unclassified Aureimonas]|uniref:RNA-binding protein n=1 Tax=unclassified Aureimonas TaxID=2615206 RepID=UPI000700AF1B|nr:MULTISPECIES: RNA-binding protein [unclassified Aureimonas]KQT64312.1 DNA-binding protein [Aureimonas sp. Leaf427]KQT81501.1 DNA-binding protein [Aureimonas sp. Leaf460]